MSAFHFKAHRYENLTRSAMKWKGKTSWIFFFASLSNRIGLKLKLRYSDENIYHYSLEYLSDKFDFLNELSSKA